MSPPAQNEDPAAQSYAARRKDLHVRHVCWATLLAAAAGLLGCAASSGSDDVVTLSAVASSGESGTATLTSLSSSTTQVAISVTGGTDTGVQSAVIRSGTCGSDGTLLAELNNLQGGSSVTTIDNELSSITGDTYSIDVQSSTNIDDIVACGEIP